MGREVRVAGWVVRLVRWLWHDDELDRLLDGDPLDRFE